MKAALVSKFGEAPRYADTPAPEPAPGEVLVTVKAAALSQLARAQAAGKQYSSGAPPLVPGVDGVGYVDGERVYFAFPRGPFGAMAHTTVVKAAYCVPVPDDVDDVTAAAIGNPGMSSWAALTERAGHGVHVNILVDGMGTLKFHGKDRDRLEQAGIKVVKYGREHWWEVKPNINHRTHRKLLIVDGRVGFTRARKRISEA